MKRSSAKKTLEISLFFALLVHIVALFAMAGLLLPGIPGVGLATVDLRASYVATHPWRWHLGWLPWHLCALSDLAISVTLLRMKQIPKRLSVSTLLLTLTAFVIEQYFETLWDAWGPHVAANSMVYGSFEHMVFVPVSFVAASLYAVMAMGWSWGLSYFSTWTRGLTYLSLVTWTILLFSAAAPLLPNGHHLPESLTNLSNQIGFVLMVFWFLFALKAVRRMAEIHRQRFT
jgi:hypothetical protein